MRNLTWIVSYLSTEWHWWWIFSGWSFDISQNTTALWILRTSFLPQWQVVIKYLYYSYSSFPWHLNMRHLNCFLSGVDLDSQQREFSGSDMRCNIHIEIMALFLAVSISISNMISCVSILFWFLLSFLPQIFRTVRELTVIRIFSFELGRGVTRVPYLRYPIQI